MSRDVIVADVIRTQARQLKMPALARSFGLAAERLTRPDELRPALERALSASGPVLLDCVLAAG